MSNLTQHMRNAVGRLIPTMMPWILAEVSGKEMADAWLRAHSQSSNKPVDEVKACLEGCLLRDANASLLRIQALGQIGVASDELVSLAEAVDLEVSTYEELYVANSKLAALSMQTLGADEMAQFNVTIQSLCGSAVLDNEDRFREMMLNALLPEMREEADGLSDAEVLAAAELTLDMCLVEIYEIDRPTHPRFQELSEKVRAHYNSLGSGDTDGDLFSNTTEDVDPGEPNYVGIQILPVA